MRIVTVIILAISAQLLFLSCESLEELISPVDSKTAELDAEQDVRNWDLSQLDTARAADYLTKSEKNVILELNKVRTNPKKYADLYLVPTLKYYQGKEYRYPGRIAIVTNEGRGAVEECIRVLSSSKPLKAFQPSKALSSAAKDHMRDTGPKGIVGHAGSDGSTLVARIQRYDKVRRPIAETIAYGQTEAAEIVKSLVVDDGVRGRGHRSIILSAEYDSVGLSMGSHASYGNVCVIDYAKYE